ncbi:unnamed protein product [Macrosiphum euphorbiae]|uniref:Uncharacterized protein n=1 Tax=Macrosiphum euphorbiae TaxID=13131 RepID=A0AAV0XAJ9_9HEMI|nr:unnamed protein product [Macrosiphum euphorbiae]
MCSMFYERWHKIAGLAGPERTLRFLDNTRDEVQLADRRGLSRVVWYAAPASVAAYASMSQIYMILWWNVVATYWFNGMGQMVVYILVFVQYYVIAREFSRVNDMVEALHVAHDPVSEGRSLARLTSVYGELCTLAGYVNRAYAPEILLQWARGLQYHPRHHGRVPTDGDRVITGQPHGLGHALSAGPALGRAVHIRAAHVACTFGDHLSSEAPAYIMYCIIVS